MADFRDGIVEFTPVQGLTFDQGGDDSDSCSNENSPKVGLKASERNSDYDPSKFLRPNGGPYAPINNVSRPKGLDQVLERPAKLKKSFRPPNADVTA